MVYYTQLYKACLHMKEDIYHYSKLRVECCFKASTIT